MYAHSCTRDFYAIRTRYSMYNNNNNNIVLSPRTVALLSRARHGPRIRYIIVLYERAYEPDR